MPDLLLLFAKRWKFMAGLAVLAMMVALIITILSPKKYLATATALPANSLTADKARLFNENIEALYSDLGSPDELDRIEGTAALDTIFIAATSELDLASHYDISHSSEGLFKAAQQLKKNTKISRSGYGELKIRVWDKDRNMAATMANTLLKNLQELHQRLQNQNNLALLQRLTEDYVQKQEQFIQAADSFTKASGAAAELMQVKKNALVNELQQSEKIISQYKLAVNANPQVLLAVENARPSLWPDKPKTLQAVLLCGLAAFAFSFLIALFVESRNVSR